MLLRLAMAAVLVVGSVELSAQGRRGPGGDRSFDSFGQPADQWCRDADRGSRNATSCDVREESLNGIASLDVEPGGNGGIRVRGTSGSTTRVRFRIVGHANNESGARQMVEGVRLETAKGRIRVSGPRSDNGEWWNVQVEIEAPRDLPLMLTTRNGGIGLEGVSGRTRFETTNGGVSLVNVAGDVQGRTVNGGLHIALEGSRWQGDGLNVETANGGVQMELPAGYNAELHAGTNNGGISVDFPITVSGRVSDLRRRIDTTLGSGGPLIRVTTSNGGVRIVRR